MLRSLGILQLSNTIHLTGLRLHQFNYEASTETKHPKLSRDISGLHDHYIILPFFFKPMVPSASISVCSWNPGRAPTITPMGCELRARICWGLLLGYCEDESGCGMNMAHPPTGWTGWYFRSMSMISAYHVMFREKQQSHRYFSLIFSLLWQGGWSMECDPWSTIHLKRLRSKYEGQWEYDRQHGHGVEHWVDGARYEGKCHAQLVAILQPFWV